MIIQNSA